MFITTIERRAAVCAVVLLTSVGAACSAGDSDDITSATEQGVANPISGVTFKTELTGNFVGAQNNGGGAVNATATMAQAWESFTLLDINGGTLVNGDQVFIQTGGGQYFQAVNGGGSTLNAGSRNQLGWETFRIVKANGNGVIVSGDIVGLQAVTNGSWVSAQNGGGGPVFAYGGAHGPWERFSITIPGTIGNDGGVGTDSGGNDGGNQIGNFPARFAAPYVPTWNDTNLVNLSNSTGNKFWTLAFIISNGSCTPTWNGDANLAGSRYGGYINALRAMGGDVIVSFGGASGTELGRACGTVASLQAAYQKVISQYNLKWIDLDIESGAESDNASVTRRNQALHNLQVANPGLHVSYTLAVDRSGLPGSQRNLLANAKANGVEVNIVNIMAMDYGPCYSDMGQAAVDAANNTRGQLAALGLSSKVGITPMIGVNDVKCEVFRVNDAQIMTNFAQANSFVGLLAYWEQNADPQRSYINIVKTFH